MRSARSPQNLDEEGARACPPPTAKENFQLIQCLRGIAATWVVLFHASEGHHVDSLKASLPPAVDFVFFQMGDKGVAIFFALSGFVIAHSIRDAEVTPAYLGRFALRRSLRLDPPYWIAIAFTIALTWVSAMVKSETFRLPTLGQIIAHLTYTQTLLGYEQINPVFWTLCYEVQFYLVLVGCELIAGRTIYLLLLAVAILWGTGALPSPPGLFVSLWHCFFAGVLAYRAYRSDAALLFLVILTVALIISGPSGFTIVSIATAWLLWVARKWSLLHLASKPLVGLGTISYSIYLIHNPVTGAVAYLAHAIGLPDSAVLLAILLSCVAAATLMWFLIERPSMRLAHRTSLK